MSSTIASSFIDEHVNVFRPLEIDFNKVSWDASITGSDKDYELKVSLQNKQDELLSNPDSFEKIKKIYEKREEFKKDEVVSRQIDLLYRTYLGKHVDPNLLKQMSEISAKVEQSFNTFRAKIDGKELTNNDVIKVLKTSKDSEELRKVWEGSKEVGKVVKEDLVKLVKLRNESAAILGFKNYHDLMLFIDEMNYDELIATFDELDKLTREPFSELKKEIDEKIIAKFGLKSRDEVRPWHITDLFFQEPPKLGAGKVDLDEFFSKHDILKLCKDFYAGINLPIDDVISASDLYEKKGKSPHAFCTDIDRDGDVRVLGNIVPGEYWLGTMLHELGHSVYSSKNMPQSIPYLLRSHSHICITEGIAMLFGRLCNSLKWLEGMNIAPTEEPYRTELAHSLASNLRAQLLIFSRWCQVMLRFERAMYENPEQDLNQKWWELVEKYQMMNKPPGRDAPDYASKIHLVLAPVYYHNYMLGEMFASQTLATIYKEVYPGTKKEDVVLPNNPKVGEFLLHKVFHVANKLSWNELTKFATGEYLNPKSFADDFKS